MIVYRVIEDVYSYDKNGTSRNEFQDYQKGIISYPRDSYNDGLNTHNYKHDTDYLHFFHFYEGALEYVSGIPSIGWDDRCFIALYNIPENLLDQYRGFGLYPESRHPNIPVLEYAIPFSKLEDGFIKGEVIPYSYGNKYSEAYKKYMEGDYSSYLKDMDELNQQFVKSYVNANQK